MNRPWWGMLSACVLVVVLAAGFLVARSSRHNALLAPLPKISQDKFKPSARSLVVEMVDGVKKEPLRADRWGELGYALAGNGAFIEAGVCFARAEELEPDNYRWPHLFAYSTIKPDRGPAIAALKRALQLHPNIVPTIAMLAEAYLEDGADKEADALLRPRVTDKTDDQRLLFEMARVEANAGAVDKAVALAERAASISPHRRQIHQLLAQLYQRSGEASKSKKQARILQLIPVFEGDTMWPDPIVDQSLRYVRDVETIAAQARQLSSRGSPEQAMQLLQQLVPEERSAPAALAALAIAKTHLGQFKEAEETLAAAPSQDEPNVVFAHGIVDAKQGKFAEAIKQFQRLASLGPSAGNVKSVDSALVNQGLCYLGLKKQDEAVNAFEKALQINPGNLEAIQRLAEIYLEKGRKADAARILEDAALLQPDDEMVKEYQQRAAN